MYNLKNESKNIKVLLTIITLLFFTICLVSIFAYGNGTLLGDLQNPNNDDVKFIRSAQILAETGVYTYHRPPNPTVFMMPGLPYTLALFILIFGKLNAALTAFRIFQAVLLTLCLLLTFLIGKKIFSSKVGIIAVLLNALYIPEVWISNLILTEALFKFFVLNLIYLSLFAIEEKKMFYYILGGISWGIATLYRPTIATFPIVILIMWIIKRYSFTDILKYTITVSLVLCAILSPWWTRNYKTFNEFIPLTKATGNPMLQGTYIHYNQSSRQTDGLDYSQFKYPAETEFENNDVEIAISKYRLKNLVPKNPLGFLYWYTIGKTFIQIGTVFFWNTFLGIHPAFAYIYHYFILLCAFFGMKHYFKDKQKNIMGLAIFGAIIYFIVVYLPFYVFSRYFYPAMPLVMIFAGVHIVKWLEGSKFQRFYNFIAN
ncbi:glycosyltransferase family 39 protein [Clostridium swellfunianum]|uniref:glycosyltransferase family 39 protein n=1 Tax=Clostridium swellfunianum TaxID=1367462 RepID=UPI00202F3933|nr:glycosyltransferase family 39 protein [Clostridium swellfunianum]